MIKGKFREAREAEQAGKEGSKDIKDLGGKPKASFPIFLICFFPVLWIFLFLSLSFRF